MQVGAQVQTELTHKRFGRAIHVAACVWPVACGGTDVYHMPGVAFNHARQHGACHVHQPFGVGVDHFVPVFQRGFIRFFQTECQTGVVNQNINVTPVSRQAGNSFFNRSPVSHVQFNSVQRVSQFGFQVIQTLFTATGGNHFMAFFNKFTCDFSTKSGSCAGNKNNHPGIPQFLSKVCTRPTKETL
ncbi:hypothetical protein SRABI106_03129 [Rahnella aquatilis]|nr:hypothetical protein SRABI106_03129 [Rahnella aquatilis]